MHRRSLLLLLALMALLTAACGARLSDAQQEALDAEAAGSLTQLGGPAETGPTQTTAAASTGAASATTAAPAAGGGDEQAATTAAPQQGGGAACRPSGGQTDVGVSDREIVIGNVSQLTGIVPGFGQTGVNGTQAYFDMVNAQGGVCGRQLKLVVADDRFSSGTNRAETEKLSDQVFALVGNTSVVDDGGAAVVEGKGIPDVGLGLSDARIKTKVNFSPSPIDVDGGQGSVGILNYFKTTKNATKVGVVFQDAAVARARLPNFRRDVEAAGMTMVEEYPVAPTETNFRPVVADIREKGIELVYTLMENNAIARLAQAFGDEPPKVPFYGAQAYGQKYLQQAGSFAEGTILGIAYAIPEDAASNPAIAKFAQWYPRSAPGADADFFAIEGWISADMFVRALTAAGPEPTRAKVLAELGKFTNYTGDGLVGNINPAGKQPARCFSVITVKGGKWVRVHPGQGFQC